MIAWLYVAMFQSSLYARHHGQPFAWIYLFTAIFSFIMSNVEYFRLLARVRALEAKSIRKENEP